MNEPWINISTRVRTQESGQVKSLVATDRLGFRFKLGESQENGSRERLAANQKSLVLVEDSDDDASLFLLALRKSGKNVRADRAANALQARQLLAGHRPALITLDCHLPGESGLDLLREIRSMESFRRIPVIMMSGTESERDVQSAYAAGANSFLRKPASCEEYLARVSLMLEYWLENNYTPLNPWMPPSCVWQG